MSSVMPPAAAWGAAPGVSTGGADRGAVAHTYEPLPVTLVHGDGAWVTDDRGRRYLDLLSAYSALNFGHRHPRLVAAAERQLGELTLTSRAFHNDQLGAWCRELADLCAKEAVVPMNTGAEAVETAIKIARRWGYAVRGVPPGRARIVTFAGNFHGRTTTIVGFSSDPLARDGFGPFAGGFDTVAFGDLAAVAAVLTSDTVAVLVEPIQGEAGVIIPPPEFLPGLRRLCSERGVLLVADEIQSGLGRTGTTFACDLWGVRPDLVVLGKALGGGIVALSAVVGDWPVIGVLTPGSHGSTFGGNPLACAVGREVIAMLRTGELQERARQLGERLSDRLDGFAGVTGVRSRGLWAGIDVAPDAAEPGNRGDGGEGPGAGRGRGRAVCEALLARGVLAKETHGETLRLAPPLVIAERDLDWALDHLGAVLAAGT